MGYTSITYFIGNIYCPIKYHVVNGGKTEVIGNSLLMPENRKLSENEYVLFWIFLEKTDIKVPCKMTEVEQQVLV